MIFAIFSVDVTGVYRATPIRVNPRMRSQKTLFKIHVDVIHYKKTDKRRLATSIDDDDMYVIRNKHILNCLVFSFIHLLIFYLFIYLFFFNVFFF